MPLVGPTSVCYVSGTLLGASEQRVSECRNQSQLTVLCKLPPMIEFRNCLATDLGLISWVKALQPSLQL